MALTFATTPVQKPQQPTVGKIEQLTTTAIPIPPEKVIKAKKTTKVQKADNIPVVVHFMENWTEDEWDNLRDCAKEILGLIDHPAVNNKAWRTKLRIAIRTIATFDGSAEKP